VTSLTKPQRPAHFLPLAAVLSIAAVVLVVCAYWPGLSGPFLLDDIGSLGDLGRFGGITDWQSFKQFVFGGVTGPTGRPLALLSFLIDGTNWPTDPWPFKRTNLVIHVLNGILVGLLCWQVLRIVGIEQRKAIVVAVLGATAWAAHPFLVSTVLYPVQRMAQLAALFCFAGLNVYAYARRKLAVQARLSYVVMTAALVLCTPLATLSKENGALLPLLILVFELTIAAGRQDTIGKLSRLWFYAFLALPSLLVAAYLLRLGLTTDLFAQNPIRNFSLYERLLTESRIVLDYLRNWFIPPLYTSGIFQDSFGKSTGLLQPVTTLLSLIVHLVVVAFCCINRRRYPLLAFGLLFFYAGHLLESTTVNLELYFEHRNYLPAAFLFLPLVNGLVQHTSARVSAAVALAACLLLAGFTGYSSTVWSSYRDMVATAAHTEPDSSRAQQQYSSILFSEGRTGEALAVANTALARSPDDQRLNLWYALLGCRSGTLTPARFAEISTTVGAQAYDLRNLAAYEQLVATAWEQRCDTITPDKLGQLLSTLLALPANADPASAAYAQLTYLRGQVELLLEQADAAMQSFRASLRSRAGAGRAMQMAALMAAHEHYEFAMSLSQTALDELTNDSLRQGPDNRVNESDIREFQARLREAMQ